MLNAIPEIPQNLLTPGTSVNAIKIATPDLIIFDESLPIDGFAQILFEDLSAQELISITRSTIVDGKNISYSLIGNLKSLQENYNTKNIFSLPETSDKYFQNFGIRFSTHVPENGTGPLGQRSYIVPENSAIANRGDLIIDVINMEKNERVDVEILRTGEPLGATIYVEES